jgi:homospermidine synthase
MKLNKFQKDLTNLFNSDINIIDNKFDNFNSIHDFLEDIVYETKEINPDNYEQILKNYLEVVCLAINYDRKLLLKWNIVLSLFE